MEDLMDDVRAIREISAWIFWPLVALTLAAMFALVRMFSKYSASKQAVCREGRFLAKRMSEAARYFLKKVQAAPLGVKLKLVTADENRKGAILLILRSHPDYQLAGQLHKLELIGLEFQDLPLPGVNPEEICAYLRLLV
ncbi:MAG: hypothetical protein A3E29_04975 [Candidatus Doudnabacteria bacterium RIFCSPHIGHO2_12_FULL_48_16]|uniref:Uncharacterized protein n=1 Tax=Candidatus Doudnabacteria bacterium RIFCSPHIGHO2_12_FULL_48_16 TaxID=1817838 RepID=A0A1F5PKJ7_9BACT|nr:MAG: hypothetical protein A3E29_04975 [Candidatus Doudnabacteria bacterium RIFCSPHIGHO2_12_FULL_48_16]OGE96530.1 MAG: hypothetical protein A2990_03420 [Candidatus Doudnabacteria bacterium RIFCSPLOWO2_01_FULL_49_40]OGF03848.1 MAG: hypothetical protein A3H14_00395 [Candidatus Doudnabacteria bacterium RIFCSPLOWO2_12_FULL_49_8]